MSHANPVRTQAVSRWKPPRGCEGVLGNELTPGMNEIDPWCNGEEGDILTVISVIPHNQEEILTIWFWNWRESKVDYDLYASFDTYYVWRLGNDAG